MNFRTDCNSYIDDSGLPTSNKNDLRGQCRDLEKKCDAEP